MQLTYAQALNLENYLYLAVTAFGVFTVVKASGAFMIVMGLALGTTGYSLCPEYGPSDSDNCRALFHCHLEVVGHTHGQVFQAVVISQGT